MTAVRPGGRPALKGLTVVEITNSVSAQAGAALADVGADVVLFEPDDLSRSSGRRQLRSLLADADVLLEAEQPGRLAELGLDYADLTRQSPDTGVHDTTPGPPPVNDRLIHVSITPFGRTSRGNMSSHSRAVPMTDLTMAARGGHLAAPTSQDPITEGLLPADSASPGDVAAQFAVLGVLTALLARPVHGSQFVDVSILAATNISAGPSTLNWLTTRRL